MGPTALEEVLHEEYRFGSVQLQRDQGGHGITLEASLIALAPRHPQSAKHTECVLVASRLLKERSH
jgi:hypothetical protein